jgi:hypothetical protein
MFPQPFMIADQMVRFAATSSSSGGGGSDVFQLFAGGVERTEAYGVDPHRDTHRQYVAHHQVGWNNPGPTTSTRASSFGRVHASRPPGWPFHAQCDAELVQSLHGFANYVPIDAECLDEIALGRPPTRAVCPFGIRQTDTLRKHLSQGQDTVSS